VAGSVQFEVTAQSSFFATESKSRASLVVRPDNLYVTKGKTPPSEAGKRGKRVLPPNMEPGKRKAATSEKPFHPDFRPFRDFGYVQAGARAAVGAQRRPSD
jgi:hypothetical protein